MAIKIALQNQSGEKIKDISVSAAFDIQVSPKSITLYVQYLRNALRWPVANTKDRSEVSGGGRKPWKQKGTGSARVGSTRSPLWIGGGVTFGPNNDQNFQTRLNKSVKRGVIASVIGQMMKAKKASVIDKFDIAKPNTKFALSVLNSLKTEGKISLIIEEKDIDIEKSFRNIPGIHVMTPHKLNMITLLSSDHFIATADALKKLEEIYSKPKKTAGGTNE